MAGGPLRSAVLVLAITMALAVGAEARHRKYRYSGDDYRYSRQFEDWRQDRAAPLDDGGGRPHEDGRSGRGAFAGVVAELIRSCSLLAAEFAKWPLDAVAQVVRPDDSQRRALEELRGVAATAVERLASECPRAIPAPLPARLDELGHAVDAAIVALDTMRPALAGFYGALDDEQKARLLLRGPVAPALAAQAHERSPDRSRRRERRHEGARAAPVATCEQLAAALRDWPIRRIERGVRLTDPQRLALYELVTASLKAADALACPAQTALTPVGRLDLQRARLAAMAAAVGAVRPALLHFYEALDQGQQQRFVHM